MDKNEKSKNSIKLVFENNPVNELITVLFSNKSETFILNKNEMSIIDLNGVKSGEIITVIVHNPFIPIEETQIIDDRNLGLKFYGIVINDIDFPIDKWVLSERKSDNLFVKKSSIYLVEGDVEKFIWSRSNFEFLLTNYSPYKKINIHIINDDFINKEFKVYINEEFYKTFNFNNVNDKSLIISIPIHRDDLFIKIESNPIVPKNIHINSNDERILGFRFNKIELSFGDFIETYSVDKIKYLTSELFDKCKIKTELKPNIKKVL